MFDMSNADFEVPEERVLPVGTGILDLGATLPGPTDDQNLDLVHEEKARRKSSVIPEDYLAELPA